MAHRTNRRAGQGAGLTLGERVHLSRLLWRARLTRLRGKALMARLARRRDHEIASEDLRLVPKGLRTADPSFATEIAAGTIGLAGQTAWFGDRPVLAITPPNMAWFRSLHGFAWLRHLLTERNTAARQFATTTVLDWLARHGTPAQTPSWEIETTGRRLQSWLVNAPLLLDDASPADYDRIMRALTVHLDVLSAGWRQAPDGHPRLVALMARALACLCLTGQDERRAAALTDLGRELALQVRADGGHVTRNPAVTVELLLDLLPIRTCLVASLQPADPAIEAAIQRSIGFLRFMRLGDGAVARFNGASATEAHSIATVLRYASDAPVEAAMVAPQSRYARLAAGDWTVIVDAGAPPPFELAGQSTASCLALELSVGREAILTNTGWPTHPAGDDILLSRATASHSTLALGASSSGRLVRHSLAERALGHIPLAGPARVNLVEAPARPQANSATIQAGRKATREIGFSASHNGYVGRFGLEHARQLTLDAGGDVLIGEDRLAAPSGAALRLKRDLPFAIHFHLAPGLRATAGPDAKTLEIVTPAGTRLRLEVTGAVASVEERRHLAAHEGPRSAQQIILRGATFGETVVTWRLARVTQDVERTLNAHSEIDVDSRAQPLPGGP